MNLTMQSCGREDPAQLETRMCLTGRVWKECSCQDVQSFPRQSATSAQFLSSSDTSIVYRCVLLDTVRRRDGDNNKLSSERTEGSAIYRASWSQRRSHRVDEEGLACTGRKR